MTERHKIGIGSRLKITKLATRTDKNKLPIWSFLVPMTEKRNGEYGAYEWVQVAVRGKCEFAENDWVQVVGIESYYSSTYRNKVGGIAVGRTIWCEIEGVEK